MCIIIIINPSDRRSIALVQASSFDIPSTSSSLRETRIDNLVRLERRNSSNSANFRALGPRLIKPDRIQEDKLNANNQDVSKRKHTYTNTNLIICSFGFPLVYCCAVPRDVV